MNKNKKAIELYNAPFNALNCFKRGIVIKKIREEEEKNVLEKTHK